jgi:hypothetical protein
MITAKVLLGMAVGFTGMIIIGGVYYGIIYFLSKAAEYEENAKRYFEDR